MLILKEMTWKTHITIILLKIVIFPEMMDILRNMFHKQQTPFLGWLGTKCFMIIDHPDDLQVVLTSKATMEKGDLYRFFNRGVGLFSAPGTDFA